MTDFPSVGKSVTVAIGFAFVRYAVAIDVIRSARGDVAGVWDGVGVAIGCGASSQLAGIGDGVGVTVWGAGGEFAGVAYAVGVAIGLRWIRDGGAVVCGVRATVAVGVEGWCQDSLDGNAVPTARRDGGARPEVSGRVALAVVWK